MKIEKPKIIREDYADISSEAGEIAERLNTNLASFVTGVTDALNRGLKLEENAKVIMSELVFTTPEDGQKLTMGDGFAPYFAPATFGPVKAYKNQSNEVYFTGLIEADHVPIAGEVVANIPEGYAPKYKLYVNAGIGPSIQRVSVRPKNGTVPGQIVFEEGSSTEVALSSIRYMPENTAMPVFGRPFPLTIPLAPLVSARCVIPVGCEDITDRTSFRVPTPKISARTSKGTVYIDSVLGLKANRKYSLIVLVIE